MFLKEKLDPMAHCCSQTCPWWRSLWACPIDLGYYRDTDMENWIPFAPSWSIFRVKIGEAKGQKEKMPPSHSESIRMSISTTKDIRDKPPGFRAGRLRLHLLWRLFLNESSTMLL